MDSWRKVRRRMGLSMDARGSDAQEMAAMAQALTREQLQQFVALCRRRYQDKRIDPGGHTSPADGVQCRHEHWTPRWILVEPKY